jgi:hypothetical protein
LLGYIAALTYTIGEIGFNLILITNYILGGLCSLIMILIYFCYKK